MSTTPTNVASIQDEPRTTAREKSKAKKKAKPGPKPAGERPTKYLPTPRITFSKQLDILRAWAAASGPTGKVASNGDVAEIVSMQASTVSLANPFFSSIGLIMKTDGGYIPAPEVMSFLRAYEWSPDSAAQKMAPILAKSWFADELLSKLAFGPMAESEAIEDLADAASAGPDYRSQLETLIDYLAAGGLIQRDGSQIKKGMMNMTPGATVSLSNLLTGDKLDSPAKPESSGASQEPPSKGVVPSLFGTTEGAVNFHVSVRVDMGEFANWKPDRIAAFFGGMAQVLAAKAKVEKED